MADHPAAAVNLHDEGLRHQQETSSRYVMDRATHNFEIINSALLVGVGVGQYIISSTFSAGGHDWNIAFYPDGEADAAAGNPSAFLCCLGLQAKETVLAKFTLTALDDQGNDQGINKDYEPVHTFTPEADVWGFQKFIEKSKLKSSTHLGSGYLKIRCVLVVINEAPTECNKNPIVVPAPELPSHLERILKNGRGADVTLLVGGTEFKAHSLILAARSPVFDAQLFSPMMNKDWQHIEVDDMEPTIFEMLLHFLYTDSLLACDEEEDNDVASMQHLLVAADRYGLDRLKVMCEEKLCDSIDAKTVTSTLTLASQHYCERLKDACVDFMSTPGVTGAVLLTEEFQRLMASCSPLVLKKDHKDKEVPPKRN